MRVFITGATGFIGMAVSRELIAHGHTIVGLVRDAAKAEGLAALGAEVVMGSLEDPEGLARHAAQADGVIHCAFNHDFSQFAENCAEDRRAIEAMGSALKGSGKPLIVTSGVAGLVGPGRVATETDRVGADYTLPRQSEPAALELVDHGVTAMTIRLPQVHDPVKQGLITYLIALARQQGMFGYIGEGANVWAAGHNSDAAVLYRLALERGKAGSSYHAVGERGVSMRAICDTLSARTGLPAKSLGADEAPAYFGWLAGFAAMDMPASSALTQEWLGWNPSGPGLLEDLARLAD
ncbi:SDR family oxidoreductase [Novosphingobium sp.]|uniref:SDR family oxidoreductase n=1 Tax=Novosphingobium sp. TaxID=1874826 RepID=UPI003D0B086B